MQNELIEKFAALLAECATTGNKAALQKEAAAQELIKEAINPAYLIGAPLLGATAGGLAGYYGTDKAKKRKRNALYGALIGGLGGAGGAMLAPAVSDAIARFSGKAAPTGPVASKPLPADGTFNAGRSDAQLVANAGGVLGGGSLGRRLADVVINRQGGGRAGELSRLQNQKQVAQGGFIRRPGAAPGKNNYAEPLSRLFEAHGMRDAPLAASLNPLPNAPSRNAPTRPSFPKDPSLMPGFVAGHPESIAAMDAYNKARLSHSNAMDEWNAKTTQHTEQLRQHAEARTGLAQKLKDADDILKSKSIGADAASRQRKVKVLEEMLRNHGYRGQNELGTGLDKVRAGGKRRMAGRVGGGVVGGLATDYVGRYLQNFIAARLGNAPAPTPETK